MGVFDDIIGSVAAEDKAVFEKYPALKISVEKLEKDFGAAVQYGNQWSGWAERNWDFDAGMTKVERGLREQLAALQAAEHKPGADPAVMAAMKKEFEDKLEATRRENLNAIEGMNTFYRMAATRILPHKAEFGEDFDPNALLTFMTEKKIADPDDAYNKMVAGKRAEISQRQAQELQVKHQTELEQARKDEREKVMREVAMGPNGQMPTDPTGGIVGVTASMAGRPAEVDDSVKQALAAAKPGDGSLAALGYQLFQQGKLPVQ